MGIMIKTSASMKRIESRYELSFKRKREDIAKLLNEISHGVSLSKIFNPNLATSVQKYLESLSLVNGKLVTPKGEAFIKYPYASENERGIYSLYLASVTLGTERIDYVIKMERKLSNEEGEQQETKLRGVYVGQEFRIGEEEKGVMELADDKSKGYVYNIAQQEISFDPINGTYESDYGEFSSGEVINNIIRKYLSKVLEMSAPYLAYDFENNIIEIKDIKELSDEDLENGVISSMKFDNVNIVNAPFEIIDLKQAETYAYLFMAAKINKDNYLTIDEMNEIFQNEVLSKEIIHPSLKDKLASFQYSLSGFEKNLGKDRYQKLSYRLNVIKTLLNIEGMKDVDGFSKAKDYDGLFSLLEKRISPSDVKKTFFVMGYPFAKNRSNNMINCIKSFNSHYGNAPIIVNKSPKEKVRDDEEMKQTIAGMGVKTIDRVDINSLFHDRYIVFEQKDGTYKTYLCTCEIGSIFNVDTGETKGTLFEIPNSELVKNGKSMINFIKE